jgi:lipid II:glycine glycyltransferase (peptidoglycan interpeptide bridge formation enzyme)
VAPGGFFHKKNDPEFGQILTRNTTLDRAEYAIEIDRIGKSDWSRLVRGFSDNNIYQSWSYGSIRWGERNFSHLLVKSNEETVAAVQLRIVKIPGLERGIAYAFRGPLWKKQGYPYQLAALRAAIKAIIREYSGNRSLFLRLVPCLSEELTSGAISMLEAEGLKGNISVNPYRTLLLDLSPSLEELRQGLRKDWKNKLNRAEKQDLHIMEGTSDEMFVKFMQVYQEMHERKQFTEFVDVNEFRRIQNDLDEQSKLRIIVAEVCGQPVASIIWSAVGDTGLTLLRATGKQGMETYAAFMLSWQMMARLKESGIQYLDLGGIDPDRNPGTYMYKKGLAGKAGLDIRFVGQFEHCLDPLSLMVVRGADRFRNMMRILKSIRSRSANRQST